MADNKGLWVTLPQQKDEQHGEVKYLDQMYLTLSNQIMFDDW